MEKDIDRIPKNPETDIVIRIDDFGGKRGLTIREFVKSDRYTGFTKSGTRIPAEHFKTFKTAINSIHEADMLEDDGVQENLQSDKNSGEKESVNEDAKKIEEPKDEKVKEHIEVGDDAAI